MKDQLRFVDLTVRIKDRVLYDRLNLTVYEGDRYIFLGPNGVGKTLLFKLISEGHSKRLSNEYRGLDIKGQILDENGNDLLNPSTKRQIAYASQDEDFYSNSSILEEAETACHAVDIELDNEKLDYLLDLFDLKGKKKSKIKNNLSGGEKKIVHLITRILKVSATNILLLDEPLNHLSFQNSKKFNDIILAEINRNPRLSIIMISHCRAMNFTEKALKYCEKEKTIISTLFKSYNCFTIDFE